MASRVLFLISVTLFCSCKTSRMLPSPFESGIFWNKEDNTQLDLRVDHSFVYENLPNSGDLDLYTCCDTITYGTWKLRENNLLEFSTPESLNIPITRMEVKEHSGATDSLEIMINSPLEDFYEYPPGNERDVVYRIIWYTNSTSFELAQVNKQYAQRHIKISIPQDVTVTGFGIEIIPASSFGGQQVGYRSWVTPAYQILEQASSTFVVELPDLSYNYLTYQRLEGDFIYVKSEQVLLWDGKEYLRK